MRQGRGQGAGLLEPLGLTATEEQIYDALVAGRAGNLGELAAQVDVSRASLTKALQALAAKGLIARLPGRAARYSAVDPTVAVAALTQVQEQALATARGRMRELASLFHSRHNGNHPAEQVEIVDTADHVWSNYIRIQHDAARQIRVFDAPPYVERHPDRENSDERVALGKGVLIRVIYARDAVLYPGRHEHIRAAARGGEQARTTESLPMKMMICDDRLALIPVHPDPRSAPTAAYLIHPSTLLDAIAALFEAFWDRAMPLNLDAQDGPADSDSVTEDDLRILALLAAGATDDAIGRATGRSMRTVQRRIRELMNLVGAQTRFQLGIAATNRRWV